jgi:decaprenylphospho-beta-D-erythro-pentofuranosid-2-ulose 2-reductase
VTALLVGGSSEIGMALLLELLGPPPRRVVLAGRPSGELWTNAEKLRAAGFDVTTTQYDATLPAAELDGLDQPLDLAIVAVGAMTSASYSEGIVVNGLSVALLLRTLVQRGAKQVVLVSSAAAVRPRPSIDAYSLGKQLADSAALLLARQSEARVVVVRPGFVGTRMTDGIAKPPLATTPQQVAKRVRRALRGRRTVVWAPRGMGVAVRILGLVPRRLLPVGWR